MDPSSSIYTGVVIVNIKFEALTSRFVVKTTPEDTVDSLKLKVQEKRHGVGHSHVTNMTVWLPKGSKKIMVLTPKRMAQALASIDTDNAEHIRVLGDGSKVANLGMSEDETLIVQLLGESELLTTHHKLLAHAGDSRRQPSRRTWRTHYNAGRLRIRTMLHSSILTRELPGPRCRTK